MQLLPCTFFPHLLCFPPPCPLLSQLHPSNPRVFMGANGTLGVGVLPVASFSGGHTYYVQRLYEVRCISVWAGGRGRVWVLVVGRGTHLLRAEAVRGGVY